MFPVLLLLQVGEPPGDLFATSIAAGRDLNSDGIPDLVVSDATSPDGAEVWFVSGIDGTVFAHRSGPPGSWGPFLDWVGDMDRDGSPDIAVSWSDGSEPHRLEILSGRDGRNLWTFRAGADAFEPFLLRGSGDYNGDGCPDLAITGSPPGECQSFPVVVRLLSGHDGSVLQEIRDDSRADSLCRSVTGIGDVDHDGCDDLAVSWTSRFYDFRRLALYSGAAGSCLRDLPAIASEPQYGRGMDIGMDFDADGVPDFLVGSPYRSSGQGGAVRVQSGRDGSVLGSVEGIDAVQLRSRSAWSFGDCVRFICDVDEDGVPDLLVGMPLDGIVGSAFLCSGRSGAVLFEIQGRMHEPGPGEADLCEHHLGAGLADAGDLDGDGTHDIAIANVPNDRWQVGRVQVVSGRTGRLLLSVDRKSLLTGESAVDRPK